MDQNKIPKFFFSCLWGATYIKIDDPFICPPNYDLDLLHLLAIPYSYIIRIASKYPFNYTNFV